jgi:Tfp pilus assembly protein PilF
MLFAGLHALGFGLAHREIKVALRAAFEAGSEKTKLAAIANAGTIALAAGDLEQADKEFRAALRLSKVAPRWRSSVIDGLCQLDLARGDISGARVRLDELPVALQMHSRINRCGHE